jgi:DNA-binding response OmpR family regulator
MEILARVLVADDDPDLLAAVAEALTEAGFDVARVRSGAGLLDRLTTDGPFDLIVTDISMPWMDGLKTLRSIRAAGLTTPVVVMTASDDELIPARVQALGRDAVLLQKPFDFDTLTAAVRRLVAPASAGPPR